jgi:hypothetical protein
MRSALIAGCLLVLLMCLGCGNGDHKQERPPVITSSPPASATEGVAYSYAITASDPSGGGFTLSLAIAPAGAQLDGNTITWTPSPSQSRQANSFSVKATNSKGVSVTQSWTVAPAGTVHVSWIDTLWDAEGQHILVHKWLGAGALVPQADGSFVTVAGIDNGDGTLAISNVPAGYFWLKASSASFYLTKSSNIDLGTDRTDPNLPRSVTLGPTETQINFKITGFEPGPWTGVELYSPEWPLHGLTAVYFGNGLAQSFTVPSSIFGDSPLTRVSVREYKSTSLGTKTAFVLGPTADLKDLAIKLGEVNNVDVPLTSAPRKSVDLNIRGSSWSHLFDHVGPGDPIQLATPFALSIEPSLGISEARIAIEDRSAVQLISSSVESTFAPAGQSFPHRSFSSGCGPMFYEPWRTVPSQAVLLQDDLSQTLEYQDPFPSRYTRQFEICQQTLMLRPSSDVIPVVTNGAVFAAPPTEIAPLLGPVETPTINDQTLFADLTISPGTGINLKWTSPSLGKPTGYIVSLIAPHTIGIGPSPSTVYLQEAKLSTATTAISLPPGLLQSGTTYYITITAVIDGRANIESSPNRLGFPAGYADVVSAPITIAAQ